MYRRVDGVFISSSGYGRWQIDQGGYREISAGGFGGKEGEKISESFPEGGEIRQYR